MRLLSILLVLLLVAPCEARRSRGYSSSCPVGAWPMPEAIEPALQAVAQERANEMARQGVLSHSISGCRSWQGLGVSEGIGCSSATDPRQVGTCVTGRTVKADAWCKSGNGMIYRVRFFH